MSNRNPFKRRLPVDYSRKDLGEAMASCERQDDPTPEEIRQMSEEIRAESAGKRRYGGRHNDAKRVEIREYHVGRLDGKTSRLPPEKE